MHANHLLWHCMKERSVELIDTAKDTLTSKTCKSNLQYLNITDYIFKHGTDRASDRCYELYVRIYTSYAGQEVRSQLPSRANYFKIMRFFTRTEFTHLTRIFLISTPPLQTNQHLHPLFSKVYERA